MTRTSTHGISVLVVDDDPSVTASLGLLLKQQGYRPVAVATPAAALAALREAPCALVLQDMNFSRSTTGDEGLTLLRRLREEHPDVPIILMTAWGSIDLAVEGMRAGAADFLTKPWVNERVLEAVETTLALHSEPTRGSRRGTAVSRQELDARYDLASLVGEAPRFLEVLELVGRIGATDASVLVLGESGTGKELVADAIHRNSRRRSGPFVKVNLGGVSSTLFESEMFGHVRGAFTDARAERKGRFEIAHGGTIFLDEVGEIEPPTQVKLLRVLQDRTYEVLGSSVTRTVDVRVVAATNRDLSERVAGGEFREDLLYRLNLITVRLPPLRDRPGDVRLLAEHFLQRASAAHGGGPRSLTAAAFDWLEEQRWPGNVRQLKQTLERSVLVLDSEWIDAGDLAALADLETSREPATTLPRPGSMTLEQVERTMIERALVHYEGNLTRVAEALGLSRPALYRRLEKYHLHHWQG